LKHFACNYNEIESGKVTRRILEILLSFPALQVVEFKGNTLGKKAA